MPTSRFIARLGALGLALFATAALADDWQAARLRGEVLVSRGDAWVRLNRGDIVSDSSVIRTMQDGNVEFARDNEVIAVGPNTQIQIFDRVGQRFTTVRQFFGAISV